MALTSKRKAGGGRKPVVLPNPFVTQDEWGDEFNVLWDTEDELDIRIEDILVGCVRSFNADKPTARQEFVNWYKLLRVYRNVWQLDSKSIADYLRCSVAQAKRYMQVVKLANPFLERYMAGKSGSNVRGYIHVTPEQVSAGYLVCVESKEGHNEESNKRGTPECVNVLQTLRQFTA